jgi:hypothetical protein
VRGRAFVAAAFAGVLAAGVVACQSSQDKNAVLAARGHTVLQKEQGLQITKESSTVKVLDTAVLADKNGAAVVVTLKNEGQTTLQNVPIAINVLNAKGKSLFKNNAPGVEKELVSVPIIQPGQTVDWVNDQVFATNPKSVKVQVGQTQPDASLPPTLPELDVGAAKVINDPVSGLEATGEITNKSQVEQDQVTLFAVARDGNKIVAAGRGGVRKVRVGGKPAHYHIFFIGDPRGAKVSVWAPPTAFN